MELQKLKDQIK